jgi:competence protein ComEC
MTLKIIIWDVRHGSGAYIQTPDGRNIVQDLGVGKWETNDEVFSPLEHLRDDWGVKQLDQVIITHPNKDHIDDIMNFDSLDPLQFLCPKHLSKEDILRDVTSDDMHLFAEYFRIINKYTGEVTDDEDLTIPENTGGVNINHFHPYECSTSRTINDHSIVTVLSYAGSKVIIPGDNEECSWKELLELPKFRAAIDGTDILIAPHHGSKHGYYTELFDYFTPKLVVVSDGPKQDTSFVSAYGQQSAGWVVHHRRDHPKESRKTVTTRSDGVIEITIGYNTPKKPFLQVKIN